MKLPRYPKYKDSGVKWLGQVPEHWEVIRLKYVASMKGRLGWQGLRSDEYTEEGPFLVTSEHFTNDRVDWNRCFHVSEDRYAIAPEIQLRPDDVLMMKDGAAMGKLAYVDHLPGPACLNSHLLLFRPLDGRFENRFLYYVLGGPDFNGYMIRERTGTTFFGISQERIASFPFAIPPRSEQERILRFIDVETSRIDALIIQQQRLISLLKEKRQTSISHAVTKGLNPKAVMKPSGVKWLGEVPAHWEVYRLTSLYREIIEAGNGELPILSVSIHSGVSDRQLDDEEMDRKVNRSEDAGKYKKVLPGDLVYNMMRAWQGGFGTVTVPGKISPAYVVARPKREISSRFVELLLRTPQAIEEIRCHSYGVTDFRLRLYWDKFKIIRVALPPKEEQEKILARIEKMNQKFDELTEASNSSIATLQERRASLISAAVTGQIDVRNYPPAEAPAVC